jgi:pimeloyl-ACP methyl ester carboxylesterase
VARSHGDCTRTAGARSCRRRAAPARRASVRRTRSETGRGVALAADAIDLLDALGLDRVAVVGHDWGARVAYTLAAVVPERVAGSPPGWFDDDEFDATALSFTNPDWLAITLNAYRSRFLPDEERDPRYEPLARRLAEVEYIATPTLMIQGAEDRCDEPSGSANQERFFTGGSSTGTYENEKRKRDEQSSGLLHLYDRLVEVTRKPAAT